MHKTLLTSFYERFNFDAGIFPWLDHITLAGLLFMLAVTPLLRTKSKLDWMILPLWVYTALDSHLPFAKGMYPQAVYLTTESRQNDLLAMIAIFVLTIKTKFNAEKVLTNLSRMAILLGVIALCFNNRRVSGLVPNKSMNGILISAMLLYCEHWAFLLLGCFVVLMSNSSSALLSFMVVIFGGFINTRNYKKIFLMCICAGICLVALFPSMLFSGDRFESYKFFFSDFNTVDWVIGKGPASFWSISIYRQATEFFRVEHGFLFWMHSDPMQFLYEYGLIMIFPFLMSFIWVLQVAHKREALAILAIVFGGIFYYPMHWPVHLFFLFLVLKLVYEKSHTYPSGPSSWNSLV